MIEHHDSHDSRYEDTAEAIADHAVKKTFAIIGVDVDNPESVEAFREDLRFGRKLRKAAEHGFLAFIGMVIIAIGAALWAGIVTLIHKGN